MRIGLMLSLLVLAACAAVPASPTLAAAPGTSAPDATPLPVTLVRYHWQLHDAVDGSGKRLDALFGRPDKPLQLDFADGRVHVRNACNGMGGSYLIVEDHLQVAPMMQTMMVCHDQTLMQRELVIKAMLRDRPTLILSNQGSTPMLTLAADDGHTLTFAGEPTAEARYGSAGKTVFLEVAPGTTPCPHPPIPDRACLQVREIHYDAQGLRSGQPGPWQPLQQNIEGYVHQPDTHDVLRVKRYALKQPPADAPSTAYVLDSVVESGTVKAADTNTGHIPPSQP
jgi:heat shock protein HslJ